VKPGPHMHGRVLCQAYIMIYCITKLSALSSNYKKWCRSNHLFCNLHSW